MSSCILGDCKDVSYLLALVLRQGISQINASVASLSNTMTAGPCVEAVLWWQTVMTTSLL